MLRIETVEAPDLFFFTAFGLQEQMDHVNWDDSGAWSLELSIYVNA